MASFDDHPIRVRDALAAGTTRAQLRTSSRHRPFWGIRAPRDASPEESFAPRLGPSAFFFGVSAARIHGLPLPGRIESLPVHVGVPAGTRRLAARDVAAHHIRIGPGDVSVVRGMRTTGIERTWCDLAACGLTLGELVAAGDAILRSRAPRSTVDGLRDAIDRYESRRGIRMLASALPLLDGRADSPAESEIRVALVGGGVRAPRVNHPVRTAMGIVHVDLAWPDARFAIEYEGDHHRTDRGQWHYDIRRYDALREAGWTIIRATARDYRDPRDLLERVRRGLR